MKSPDLINLNLTWALHEVLSLYEKDMVKLMIILMKLSLKCKFGCGLYLKKSLITYLHLTFIHQRLFLWFLTSAILTLLADLKEPSVTEFTLLQPLKLQI